MNNQEKYRAQLNQERNASRKKATIEKTGPEININPVEFIMLLILAFCVDTIDWLDLTGVGAIVARLVDLPMLGLLWAWRIIKIIERPDKVRKKAGFKLVLFFLLEISPVGLIPFWTAYIIYTWLGEKKAARISTALKIKKSKVLSKNLAKT